MSDTLTMPAGTTPEAGTVTMPEQTKESRTTEYVVLKKAGGSSTWAEFKRVEAASARAAVHAVVKDPGEYLAVPSRSWNPMTVKVETKTELKIS